MWVWSNRITSELSSSHPYLPWGCSLCPAREAAEFAEQLLWAHLPSCWHCHRTPEGQGFCVGCAWTVGTSIFIPGDFLKTFLMSRDLFSKAELIRTNGGSGVVSSLVILRRTSWNLCSVLFLWVYFEGFFHCTSIFFSIIKFDFGRVCELEVAELESSSLPF